MKRQYIAALTILSACLAFSPSAIAHSGGTNSDGCHAGSQPYHCHNRPAPTRQTPVYRSAPTNSAPAPARRTRVDAWSAPYASGSGVVCIQDGPTNIRTSPNALPSSIRATLSTGSCGRLPSVTETYKNGYFLVEFYIQQIGKTRRYWVHESQV